MLRATMLLLMWVGVTALAETNSSFGTNSPGLSRVPTSPEQAEQLKVARQEEQIRARCIDGRRYVAGRVLQVLPEGLVVDSGYSALLSAPFNHSWVLSGTVSLN